MAHLIFMASHFVCYFLLTLVGVTRGDLPPLITIGAALSSETHRRLFTDAVNDLNNKTETQSLPGVLFKASSILMDDNPIRSAKVVCENLIPSQVYVVIASHPPHESLSPMAVSFTCGFYKIPVIGMSARDSVFSDKNVHSLFMRTVPPYSEQAQVWAALLQRFYFKKVIFIHSSDQEGRATLGKFQSEVERHEITIVRSIQYTAGLNDYSKELSVILGEKSRVLLLYATADDAEIIYSNAEKLNLTSAGYAWIVTEQALQPQNTPIGVLGLKLVDSDEEDKHIRDSVELIYQAMRSLQSTHNISEAPNTCDEGSVPWNDGQIILDAMKRQVLEYGETRVVKFNDVGDRLNAMYKVVNVVKAGGGSRETLVQVGEYVVLKSGEPELSVQESNIVWPGNNPQKPLGVLVSNDLKVVTKGSVPFVFVRETCLDQIFSVPCSKTNSTDNSRQSFCCYGYAIDLLNNLSMVLNFSYALYLQENNDCGTFEARNGSRSKTWNGMIGELVDSKADLIVAPLTINPERAEHIDFSKPFKYQGLTILIKRETKSSNLGSFLQPFEETLWILVALSVHVVGLVLYLLDRFSPFGRFKLAKNDDTEEDALNLSSAMWFAWGVLLNSGIGEGTPRSFSARVLGMVWAGFAMIIVASYTANLAAFLVLDRPEASISGIDDTRLRNPQDSFKFATVRGSPVAMYFKRQVELSTMSRTMDKYNRETAEDAIQAVKDGKLDAFIWDSSRLQYEAALECDLVTAGELFGRSGYGIGLQKNSEWTRLISLEILSFHEMGLMEQLDAKWIRVEQPNCPHRDKAPSTLGLTNMAGVFMMVAGGIIAGVFLIFIEIAYKRHRGLKEKELELAKTAADRWRGNIEKRKLLRQSRQYLKNEKLARNGPQESSSPNDNLAPFAIHVDPNDEPND